MDETTPSPLSAAVGRKMREYRLRAGLLQDGIARVANYHGIPWVRSTVTALENGRRELSAAELLALPEIFSGFISDPFAPKLSLHDFIPSEGELDLDGAIYDAGILRGVLAGEYFSASFPPTGYRRATRRFHLIPDDMDQRAGSRLGVGAQEVREASLQLWNRSLDEEREIRLESMTEEGASPRSLQAMRGHITRDLLAELRTVLNQGGQ